MSRSAPVAGPSISLFPFLAVLLCTMGSLLVLLVLFSRSAKQGETAEAARVRQELESELELARDELVWRRQQLEGVRARTAEDLARARLQLAGIEENSRALVDELDTLERSAAALAAPATTSMDEAVLGELESRLKSSRESLEKARADRDSRPPAYAVVPYVGASGTHRRPLYIECCGDGVFLQPEGIRLSPGDFEGPPGPGNPLACALRVAREHIVASQGGTSDPAAQPYPLLLVRPSGVMAYYAAREAIQSWGSDFGYQLIDEDWTLAFPPADPMLAQLEKRAIEESRARLAWLADARPAKPVRPVRHYRAAPTRGGVVADGGPSVLGDQSRFDWANQQQAERGAGGGQESALGSEPGGGGGKDGGSGNGNGARGSGAGDGSGRMRGALADDTGTGAPGSGGDGIFGGAGGKAGGPAARGQPGGVDSAGGRFAAGTASGTFSESAVGGGSRVGSAGGQTTADAAGAAGGPSAGGTQADGRAGGGQAGAGQEGALQAGGGGRSGGGDGPAMPGLHVSGGGEGGRAGAVGGTASASASIAQSRGKNWASLATQDRPIPLTRPIRVECAAHEFRILDDAGRRVQTRIPVDADTITAIDPLIGAIHARVQGWGLAGDRMYWRPQLVLSETADGRGRREDLERLLADSGIDTRFTDQRDQVRPLPPVTRNAAITGR